VDVRLDLHEWQEHARASSTANSPIG